jgi:hypothetical protein
MVTEKSGILPGIYGKQLDRKLKVQFRICMCKRCHIQVWKKPLPSFFFEEAIHYKHGLLEGVILTFRPEGNAPAKS